MTNQHQTFTLTANIPAPLTEVWEILSNPARVKPLMDWYFYADLNYTNSEYVSGNVDIDAVNYEVRLKPYAVILVSRGVRIDIALRKTADGCAATATVLLADAARQGYFDARLREFLSALGKAAEPGGEWTYHARPQDEKNKKKPKKKKGRGALVAVVALLLVAALAGGLFALRDRTPQTAAEPDIGAPGAGLTAENALGLALGMPQADVAALFGTDGHKTGDGTLYRSAELSPLGKSRYMVLAVYEGGALARYTYLDTEVCAAVDPMGTIEDLELRADMKPTEVEAAVGRPVSMVRASKDAAGAAYEYHFGFVDPFANFNEAWRGEYVFFAQPQSEVWSWERWGAYDGVDPLMIDSLEGRPIANQYTDYTTFLDDWHYYNRARLLLNRFSRGDIANLFDGELVEYAAAPGARFYEVETAEALPYKLSVGLDSMGRFHLASYVNLNLFEQQDMLKDSKYADVSRGMTYGEISRLMGVLPTAFTIDSNFFTVCYGSYKQSGTTEEQFEFVVRFDLQDGLSRNVFNNMNAAGTDPDVTWGFGDDQNGAADQDPGQTAAGE